MIRLQLRLKPFLSTAAALFTPVVFIKISLKIRFPKVSLI